MLPSLWAGCCLGGKTSAGLISALNGLPEICCYRLWQDKMSSYTSPVEKKQKFTQILCAVITSLWKGVLSQWRILSVVHQVALYLSGFIWSHSKNLKTPSRSSSLSRQPCFFFFFSFLKIYIFLFVFVLLLLQTVKEKTLIANGCIRKKNGKKNLQKKKNFEEKKKNTKNCLHFPFKIYCKRFD